MTDSNKTLDTLLSPESIAVVGASPDSWYAANIIDNLLEYGYDGRLYLINPGREEAWGRTCYDDLSSVPKVVDLAVISVPRNSVVSVIKTAGEIGVPAALVITAGFSEADDEGKEIEADLAAAATEHDILLCGPNSIGFANTHADTVVASTCSRQPSHGSIGLVSQSGALAFTTFFDRGEDQNIGFANIVSTGNEIDQTLTDYVEYMGNRESIDVVIAYIEGIDEPRRFMKVADDVIREGTPILVIKIGRSDRANAATVSHTGSLTGNDDAWQAAFAQTGVQRVEDIPDLLGNAKAHVAADPPESNRICVASTSGGLASLLADLGDVHGLDLPSLAQQTEQALLDHEGLLTFNSVSNPIDIRGYGADHLPEIAELLFNDDRFDGYLFALGLSAVDDRAERLVDDIRSVAAMTDDPVCFLWTGRQEPPEGQANFYKRLQGDVPLYTDPAQSVEALASLVEFGQTQARAHTRPSRAELTARSEQADKIDVPAESVLSWEAAVDLLEIVDISMITSKVAANIDQAVEAAQDIGFPVAMKVDSPDIPHRNKIGAVEQGITNTPKTRSAYRSIMENARAAAPEAQTNRVVVQPSVTPGVEVLLGMSTDEDFGPLVTIGSGGVDAEIVDGNVTLVPPFTRETVINSIRRTHLHKRIRKQGVSDSLDTLVSLVVAVSELSMRADNLDELDLNPIILNDNGVHPVDVLARTE